MEKKSKPRTWIKAVLSHRVYEGVWDKGWPKAEFRIMGP